MEMTHPSGTLKAPADMAATVVARSLVTTDLAAVMTTDVRRGVHTGVVPGPASMKLADLAIGATARVVSVSSPDPSGSTELGRRLAELGFLPGEKLRIVARGLMGREPIAVRIGTGTFALRLFEAACVRVCPEQSLLR